MYLCCHRHCLNLLLQVWLFCVNKCELSCIVGALRVLLGVRRMELSTCHVASRASLSILKELLKLVCSCRTLELRYATQQPRTTGLAA